MCTVHTQVALYCCAMNSGLYCHDAERGEAQSQSDFKQRVGSCFSYGTKLHKINHDELVEQVWNNCFPERLDKVMQGLEQVWCMHQQMLTAAWKPLLRWCGSSVADTETNQQSMPLVPKTCMYVCMHTYIHTCIHTYLHTYIHIYRQTDRWVGLAAGWRCMQPGPC